ncbi:uncharacterized protein BP5553_09944 [Venustampulla echinocandica]|uniref:Xylanolytic transcriptional activator regulatory domain-containing protein n=1 Tax=Venustampulla echinocandica TaxID=2656787 RepID=A0A370TB58_9HELO|nr:uncharacterized protein BP5553_09944 [Venustampulla echinocandica]RDL31155.1 hypothetical protein BP5553_09944 [Venustampulla echinocandica]
MCLPSREKTSRPQVVSSVSSVECPIRAPNVRIRLTTCWPSAYKDMAQRLAKMERLISDLALGPNGADEGTSPSISESSQPEEPSKEKVAKKSPPVILSSDMAESDFSWAIPEETHPGECPANEGVHWVNYLVGDDSFGQMMAAFKPIRKARELEFDITVRHPLPPDEVLLKCVHGFSQTLNKDITVFREEVIMDGLQSYLAGSPHLSTSWWACINIIVAHSLRDNPSQPMAGDCDKYLYNALSLIPAIILQSPEELCIGALLSMAMYFMFAFENRPATSILGLAIQQMIIGGYHNNTKPPGCSELDFWHRRRLFWNGYILDMDLSLRLGKPPAVNPQIIELQLPPDQSPDGIGVRTVRGVSFNFLREHFALAKIQHQAYLRLHSRTSTTQTPEQLYSTISELDDELQKWRENIPEVLRPQTPLDRVQNDSLIMLTVLHYTYFQLIIAIHSVVFHGFKAHNASDRDARIIGSVALCVGAARASIALLNYHRCDHPFTRYLVNHIAWSVDVLFMNILQNKTSPQVVKDLKLLQRIVEFYEKSDPNRSSSTAYQVTKSMYIVASRAVNKSQGEVLTSSQEKYPAASGTISSSLNDYAINSSARFQPQHPAPSIREDMGAFNGGLGALPYLESEWMMPLGFQPEYWQDPWANVFQEQPGMQGLSLQ